MSAALNSLVISGKKTATCSALALNEKEPAAGDRDIVLSWDGRPCAVIETIEVTQRKFCDVDEEFALAEGENDTLEGWRSDHRAFFERNGGWSSDMMLLCERFKVLQVIE